MTITRTPTDAGQVVRFYPPGPMPIAESAWRHKGEVPSMDATARGRHVLTLVALLNPWWEKCNWKPESTADINPPVKGTTRGYE